MSGADRARHAAIRERPPADFSSVSDQELVQWVRAGREDAVRDLLRRYQDPIFKFLYLKVQDREQAEDLTQDTFVKVLDSLDTYRGDGKLSSWITKIANRVALDYFRTRLRERETLQRAPLEITPGRLAGMGNPLDFRSDTSPRQRVLRELGPALEKAVGRLRTVYRLCIVLKHFENQSYEEIAKALDVPVGTVGTYLHRARTELKRELHALGDAWRTTSFRYATLRNLSPPA